MNNIYKVIWSKAKNCYVVASEIAKSHTKSASGSEKMGGYGKKALLALAAASAIFCGGLVNVGATVHVNDATGVANEVYTMTEVNTELEKKADKTAVEKIENTVGGVDSGLVKKTNDNATGIEVNKTNIKTLQDNVGDDTKGLTKKINDNTAAIAKKADTAAVTTLEGRVEGVEGKVTTLETTVGDASNGLVRDVNELKTQGNNLNNALGNKADQSALVAAIDRITTNETNITALQKKTTGLSADGKSLTEMNSVETGALTVKGEIKNDAGVTTTLTDIKASMDKANANETAIGQLQTTTTNQQTAIDGLNAKTTKITYDASNGTSVDGVTFNAGTVTGVTSINGTKIGMPEGGKYISQDGSIWGNMKKVDTQVETNENNIETNKTAITNLDTKVGKIDDRTGGITRNPEKTQTTIEGAVKVDNQGNVKDVKGLSAETITTGALTVTGASDLKGNVILGTNAANTVTVKGTADFNAAVKMNNGLNVTNGETNLKKTTVDGDLKVTGTITTDKMIFGDPATNNYTEIDKGKVTSKNLVVNGAGETISSSSTFDVEKNEVGFTNTATGDHSYHKQTAKGINGYVTDKDGNKTYTKVTATENSFQVQDKDGKNKNHQVNTKDSSVTEITNGDGKTTKTEQTATDITNTAKDGTITNDANHIVNKANTMDTNVTGKATESYGSLDTTVNGNETHIVTGTKTETVDGMVTENYKAGQATNVTGNQDIHVTGKQTNTVEGGQENIISGGQTNTITGGQINNITGDQTTNVSGTQTTTATDINRNASSSMVDKVDNAYGTNTETKEAGKTTTDVSIKGTGEKGQYIRGATESRDYLIKDTSTNTETKTAEATSTEITDGTNKASTIQDAKNLAGSVTNGTETGVSGIHANDDGSVSIDSAVAGGGMSSVINQKKDSIQSAVGDGTNSTVIHQDKDNVTIASSNGMVGLVGKDIVNNAQDTITNTAGTSITNQVNDSKVTTDANGTTFENNTPAVSDGGATTTKINGNQITTGRVDANELGVSDKDGTNTADLSVKAGEGVKASASDGTTTGSLDVTADEVGSTVKDASGKGSTFKQRIDAIMMESKDVSIKAEETLTNEASEIKNQADKLISNKVGENTLEKMEDGKITTSITKGTKANTVISTADGTSFINSEAAAPVTGASGAGMAVNTTIKGNTINTGKVTMDYAEVMKDLGVHGNAKVDQDLEVGGTSTLKGDVTMESNAKVKKDLTVEGTTTTKTLKVTENAEIDGTLKVAKKATFEDSVSIAKDLSVGGDVTANSYKVGDKTYISAAGINANDQKITNVADGSISEGSKDAVNGGQLYGVKRDLEHQVDKVGANAAAMANLRPMEFDPSSKWNIAAAIGNYGSETAAALGAFYRPNDNVMVNLSTAFGTGENMVGGGVSVRLGKGGNKLSREETNALKAQVADLTARMDALLSVLNPNMSKDFPDVPENHWAYEAVSRLAGNDIVQGYPDGEFHGERTMTRYEMAEIIYNALSRGAEAEKELVEEFKPELQAMAASEKATAEKAEG